MDYRLGSSLAKRWARLSFWTPSPSEGTYIDVRVLEHCERTNRVNRRMSRKIPRVTKDLAFRLWLQGRSYREIRDRTRMSMGAINQLIADVRRETPGVDQLRELNVVLSRGDSTVYDAMRGGRLLDKVGQLGVSLDELESYVKLTERISYEKEVEAERFVESAMKLMDLESQIGKTYEEVVKDFEGRTRQIEGLEAKAKGVQGEIQRLMERKAQLEGEIREAEKRLSLTRQELNKAINIQERLQKLGIDRVASLAKFVEDYEVLKFSVEEVQRLAEWRKSLTEMRIDPDGLEQFIKKKGPLEIQVSKMRREAKAEEGRVESLSHEIKRLLGLRVSIQGEISKLSRLNIVLEKRKMVLPCKVCGREGIFMELPGRKATEDAMAKGLAMSMRCTYCGQWVPYSLWDMLANIRWLALSEL